MCMIMLYTTRVYTLMNFYQNHNTIILKLGSQNWPKEGNFEDSFANQKYLLVIHHNVGYSLLRGEEKFRIWSFYIVFGHNKHR